ncbi:unnamed protein product [Cochlearia groenlandica]
MMGEEEEESDLMGEEEEESDPTEKKTENKMNQTKKHMHRYHLLDEVCIVVTPTITPMKMRALWLVRDSVTRSRTLRRNGQAVFNYTEVR